MYIYYKVERKEHLNESDTNAYIIFKQQYKYIIK